jgi:hypothetical protein
MLYIVLLHYPVCNKEGQIVATSIANMDIHDIARIAKTYGVLKFYIVNPVLEQRILAQEIMNHWQEGYGAEYNKFRQAAFELVKIKETLAEVLSEIAKESSLTPRIIVTGANFSGNVLSYAELKKMVKNNESCPFLIIFGTGSGLAEEIVCNADFRLESIKGAGHYNHLSVRSAVAIVLDRVARD